MNSDVFPCKENPSQKCHKLLKDLKKERNSKAVHSAEHPLS